MPTGKNKAWMERNRSLDLAQKIEEALTIQENDAAKSPQGTAARSIPLAALLLPWYAENRRMLPWREDRQPYHIWLSEIMLQQTRVEAVKDYYTRFLQQLPTVASLAEAEENLLLKLWEGLGYYSRVRNLQKAARIIMERHEGFFPQTHEELLALPGIGPYTAGAIGSIAFELPTPAVDGNVLRVWTRLYADASPVTEERVKRRITEALVSHYPEGQCGDFTQALMELGATVCLPNGTPLCDRCPLKGVCEAEQAGTQQMYPVKAPKKPRRIEERTVLILRLEDRVALCKRPSKGLLAGLWQLPDACGTLTPAEALELASAWGVHPTDILRVTKRTHIFTHVQWDMTGIYLTCAEEGKLSWFTPRELEEEIGLPTAYKQFLTE